jgi:hypothetical protein
MEMSHTSVRTGGAVYGHPNTPRCIHSSPLGALSAPILFFFFITVGPKVE